MTETEHVVDEKDLKKKVSLEGNKELQIVEEGSFTISNFNAPKYLSSDCKGYSEVNIKDCNIHGEVVFSSFDKIVVKDCDIIGNMIFRLCDEIIIENVKVFSNNNSCIRFEHSNSATIKDSEASGGEVCISIFFCSNSVSMKDVVFTESESCLTITANSESLDVVFDKVRMEDSVENVFEENLDDYSFGIEFNDSKKLESRVILDNI